MSKEGLSASVPTPDGALSYTDERLTPHERSYLFVMRNNGYFLQPDGWLDYSHEAVEPLVNEFKGQRVSFFGPSAIPMPHFGVNTRERAYFSGYDIGSERFVSTFKNNAVTNVIEKFREVDEDQAARLAFLLGGLVRYMTWDTKHESRDVAYATRAIDFTARMTNLGREDSADAIASAMAMYAISGGALEEDRDFTGDVYQMEEAIHSDPVDPKRTEDLGVSQVSRLHAFINAMSNQELADLPDTSKERQVFDGFPTVGAEFHFPVSISQESPRFWQRLALLNMSQYQRGSYIQLSRNDRDVIEVRMNPSIYPVTIANWEHMMMLLPELKQAYFTLTLNRNSALEDFSWSSKKDTALLHKLQSLGLLSYASVFDSAPPPSKHREELRFGGGYLGQTVRVVNDGEYKFSGHWAGNTGRDFGQVGIYTGFGKNFPYLAYYTSMALANPDILKSVEQTMIPGVQTLDTALSLDPTELKEVFTSIQKGIAKDASLRQVADAGSVIMQKLQV